MNDNVIRMIGESMIESVTVSYGPTSDPILDSLENLHTKINNLHEQVTKFASPTSDHSDSAKWNSKIDNGIDP